MTLALSVTIPAYKKKKVPRKWFVTMAISYHLNGSETNLKKVNGYQENDGC